ncbi:MAG: hypothetical protein A3C50_04095 [Candidatus Staskawiczbacteria bacterium RIFCSPHIGHO2_02_FULL_43_16]|uniref:Uncharacterized protein n=1 Tax=Candidatus Staskawiczbacteria bacterium RIFCSPHIGHO2_01_FULL_41_41 TaxID=1802203 RepID=A0A1G2HRG4_9BACT|nr:MAG: hypothetical protein A2822_00390 [Candidatus Staskawiczbacteria bacterium RIFCSPHIGHO2_01_FULL_41_41]OGZ68111.1 MAG: hypothetical protein A3C50_04095 [Candidatus Staskawiczbacteria bacterium RIFCSPHIGHO2_02_FULL_43_16]OGZ74850.1 MAG: hypothetical protein A3A12_03290 [Candidatus Staskawiczbacteria bacterium RIFCSPLOWO2_01_FULL_43_17b]
MAERKPEPQPEVKVGKLSPSEILNKLGLGGDKQLTAEKIIEALEGYSSEDEEDARSIEEFINQLDSQIPARIDIGGATDEKEIKKKKNEEAKRIQNEFIENFFDLKAKEGGGAENAPKSFLEKYEIFQQHFSSLSEEEKAILKEKDPESYKKIYKKDGSLVGVVEKHVKSKKQTKVDEAIEKLNVLAQEIIKQRPETGKTKDKPTEPPKTNPEIKKEEPINPLKPGEISAWSVLLKKNGYPLEKLSPIQLRKALFTIYDEYGARPLAKNEAGNFNKIKDLLNKIDGGEEEKPNEQIDAALAQLFNIKQEEVIPPPSKPEQKPEPRPESKPASEPVSRPAPQEGGSVVGMEKIWALSTIDQLKDELNLKMGVLGTADRPGMVDAYVNFWGNEKMNRFTGASKEQKEKYKDAKKEERKRLAQEVAKLKEYIARRESGETKPDLQAGVDTKPEMPVPKFEDDELGRFNRESIEIEKLRAKEAEDKRAQEAALPKSKKELFEAKKDELAQSNNRLEAEKMYAGSKNDHVETYLLEKREELFKQIGELVGEDFKQKVNVETKKILGKKEMSPERFKAKEMPKIIREIEAEQKLKAQEMCAKSGEALVYQKDHKNSGDAWLEAYMNEKIEASGLEPNEFYAMVCRGVRVDLFKEKVAFWKSAWNFVRGKEIVAHKYIIPIDGGDTIYLSEDELEGFLLNQANQTRQQLEKTKEEKFVQRLKEGRVKLRESRAKVAQELLDGAEVKYYDVYGKENPLAQNWDFGEQRIVLPGGVEVVVAPKNKAEAPKPVQAPVKRSEVKQVETKPSGPVLPPKQEKPPVVLAKKAEPTTEKPKLSSETKTELDKKIQTIFDSNPEIEGVFDSGKGWPEVRKIVEEMIREMGIDRKEGLKIYKETLLRQQEALADCYNVIKEEIENNPGVAQQKLFDIVEKFSKNYGFTEEQISKSWRMINEYTELRKRAIDFLADHRHDDKGLLEKLTGKTLTDEDMKGIYKISVKSMAIVIEANDEMTQKLRSKQSKQSAKWLGFHNAGSWLEQSPHYVVINRELITKLSGEKDIEKVLAHELQHAENDVLEEVLGGQEETVYYMDYRNEKDPKEKAKKLEQYLRQVQREALNSVRDEIITSFHNVGTDKAKLEELFIAKEKGWLKGMIETVTFSGEKVKYDFLKEARNKKLYYADKDLSKKLFDQQYKRVIKDALSAFSDLIDPKKGGYSVEKAVALLMGKELYFWPTNVKRLLGKGGNFDIAAEAKKVKEESKKEAQKKLEPGIAAELKNTPRAKGGIAEKAPKFDESLRLDEKELERMRGEIEKAKVVGEVTGPEAKKPTGKEAEKKPEEIKNLSEISIPEDIYIGFTDWGYDLRKAKLDSVGTLDASEDVFDMGQFIRIPPINEDGKLRVEESVYVDEGATGVEIIELLRKKLKSLQGEFDLTLDDKNDLQKPEDKKLDGIEKAGERDKLDGLTEALVKGAENLKELLVILKESKNPDAEALKKNIEKSKESLISQIYRRNYYIASNMWSPNFEKFTNDKIRVKFARLLNDLTGQIEKKFEENKYEFITKDKYIVLSEENEERIKADDSFWKGIKNMVEEFSG